MNINKEFELDNDIYKLAYIPNNPDTTVLTPDFSKMIVASSEIYPVKIPTVNGVVEQFMTVVYTANNVNKQRFLCFQINDTAVNPSFLKLENMICYAVSRKGDQVSQHQNFINLLFNLKPQLVEPTVEADSSWTDKIFSQIKQDDTAVEEPTADTEQASDVDSLLKDITEVVNDSDTAK